MNLNSRSSFSIDELGPGTSSMPPGDKTLLPLVGKSLLVLALITPEKPEGVKVSVPPNND